MSLLPDWRIRRDVKIIPFSEEGKRKGIISYGVSSYGYDVRVGYKFKIFTPTNCAVVDPKNFDPKSFVDVDITPREGENVPDHILIPPNSFCLSETLEYFEIPDNVVGLVTCKSTYARCAIIVPSCVLEPCVSEDTEVLTPEGWVPIGDVQIGDHILTRREDGVSEFSQIERKQERFYEGNLLHFRGRSVDQLVTPDHKLFVHHRHDCKNNLYKTRLIEAAKVFGKRGYQFDRKVEWKGFDWTRGYFSFGAIGEEKYPTNVFLEFLGCWLGDGSAFKGTDGGHQIKLAVVTKEEKRKYFKDVLLRLGIEKFHEHERGFLFYSKPLMIYLRQFGHAKEKFIDRNVLNLPSENLQFLLKGLMASDGNQETQTYHTSSRRLADDVQELAFKVGKAAIVREIYENTFGYWGYRYKVRVCGDKNRAHMTPSIGQRRQEKIFYKGMVYDVTVPNHVFFCRRDGKASWTGNCWKGKLTLEISNCSSLPAKVYAANGLAQILFFEALEKCEKTYETREGKYQDQKGLTLPFVEK